MSSNINRFTANFYLFLGFHNLLLGLFPFFLPVYLFKQGAELPEIAFFIALTGFSFAITLWIFDKYRTSSCLIPILLSLVLEGFLLLLMLSKTSLLLVALINGSYCCLYWTIQRVFFLAGGTAKDSGRRFGNFQIYVLIVLQIGIFIGSVLLEEIGIWSVSLLSLLISGYGVWLFYQKREGLHFPLGFTKQRSLSLAEVCGFSDNYRSKTIFVVDGIFLYLESYFWVISLFLVVGENFVRLGGLVVCLALFLGLLFYFIKNSIDRLDHQKVFLAAVFLYMISWEMRGCLSEEMQLPLQLCLLMFIGFCTSFFRLALNKRFFDIARETSMYHYLFSKSYYSQIFLGVGFCVLGLYLLLGFEAGRVLPYVYWFSGLFAASYFMYLPARQSSLK